MRTSTSMSPSPLPNYLRAHRKRTGLSQKEVSFLVGSDSEARISRHERRKQTPALRTLLAYEILFGTPIRELYSGVAWEVEKSLKQRIRLLLKKLAKTRRTCVSAGKLKALLAVFKPKGSRDRSP